MLYQKNSKKQGDVGLAIAIAEYAKLGYTILTPLSDSQSYDLALEKGGKFLRVQVKTSKKPLPSGNYYVELRTISNTRGRKFEVRKLSKANCELVFIVTQNGKLYSIPSRILDGRGGVTLSREYDRFLMRSCGGIT